MELWCNNARVRAHPPTHTHTHTLLYSAFDRQSNGPALTIILSVV